MPTCPDCGEIIMEGDPYCSSCGAHLMWSDDSQSTSSSGIDLSAEGFLQTYKMLYEDNLERARKSKDGHARVMYYGDALRYAQGYWKHSGEYGCAIDGMPDINSIFSAEDISWMSDKHYASHFSIPLWSIDETEELEVILKATGNAGRVWENYNRIHDKRKADSLQDKVNRLRFKRESYFEHIGKANDAVEDKNPKNAMKEYRKAIEEYDSYMASDNNLDECRSSMPEDKLTSDAADHLVELYRQTHPLLTSCETYHQINGEVVEMLDGKWDDRISEADRDAQEILSERKAQKQMKKEERQEKVVDVIVGARIAGDKISNLFNRL